MSAPKKPDAAPAKQATPPVKPVSAYTEIITAISLVEVAVRSLEFAEVGTPEQVTLKKALRSMWLVHDRIDELGIDATADDGDDE